jgi:hypothetical protein
VSCLSHVTVFLAIICHTFLASCLTRHRFIFLPNFATSVALIFLTELSLATPVYRRLGVHVLVTNQTDPKATGHLFFKRDDTGHTQLAQIMLTPHEIRGTTEHVCTYLLYFKKIRKNMQTLSYWTTSHFATERLLLLLYQTSRTFSRWLSTGELLENSAPNHANNLMETSFRLHHI